MNFKRLLSAVGIGERAAPLSWSSVYEALTGQPINSALPAVTTESAMKTSAVWGCMQVLSNAHARVPAVVFRKTDRGRERADDHPVYRLVKDRPNPWMTPFQLRRVVKLNRLGFGRGLCIIERNADGVPVALWPVHGSRVRVVVHEENNIQQVIYAVAQDGEGELNMSGNGWRLMSPKTGDGRYEIYSASDVLDFQGLSFDGVNCLSAVQHMKSVIQQHLAAESTLTTFSSQGLKAGGFLLHPNKLSPEAHKRIQESFNAKYGRADFAGKTVVLEEGLKFEHAPTVMTLADAQWIEASKMRIEDIARFFGVPLHLIQSLDKATNNNIEHQSLDFLNHSLAPDLENDAQEMTYKLLTEEERAGGMYIGHITQAILSVDMKSRYEAYMLAFQMGVVNADGICDREDMNRPSDGSGATYYRPLNQGPALTPDEARKLVAKEVAPPPAREAPPADASGDDSSDDDTNEGTT
jgi:HK97 family phage portal protein